jgi:hypothetical protein
MQMTAVIPKETRSVAVRTPRTVLILSSIILVLAAVAAAGGLFIPDLYRDNPWVVQANRGMDLFTLAGAVPALGATLVLVRRGSVRARLAMAGVLGYILYTYIGGAFAFALNLFYPIYIALFSLTAAALVALLTGIDAADLQRRFDARTPRIPVAVFLAFIAFMLFMTEGVGQLMPFFTAGTLPEMMQLAGAQSCFVYTMDLGVIAPLSVLAAVWLWRRLPWGDVLAGILLIKCATMGLALLTTNWLAGVMGQHTDGPALIACYLVLVGGGLGMVVWLFRHCRA